MNYPSPCEKCENPCGGSGSRAKTCSKYVAWVNACWKFSNIQYRRLCRYSHTEEFQYEHPDVYRRYIERGPCPDCAAKENCQTVCATYWKWWDVRMAWFRRRLRV